MKSSDAGREIRNRTLKSLIVGGIVAALLAWGWSWIGHQPQIDGAPWVLRKTLEFNGRIWSRIFSTHRQPPHHGAPPGTPPRFNGDLGLTGQAVNLKTWRLHVYVENKEVQALPFAAIRWLPRTDTATEFYCIEGWSTQFTYSGVKFSDFMKTYGLSDQFQYVGLETPDRGYYVSIDMDSMMHPQTLLAYEMNERPLSSDNGFPLRLIIPIKYGIKSLKQIGTIRLSNTRPPDYWAERGYDWYSGL